MKRYTVHWYAEMRRPDRWGVWVVKRDGADVRTFPLAGMSTDAMNAAYHEACDWARERNHREEGDDAPLRSEQLHRLSRTDREVLERAS